MKVVQSKFPMKLHVRHLWLMLIVGAILLLIAMSIHTATP